MRNETGFFYPRIDFEMLTTTCATKIYLFTLFVIINRFSITGWNSAILIINLIP